MRSDRVADEAIHTYLLRVKEKLRDLPPAQVAEILTELRSHILDSATQRMQELPTPACTKPWIVWDLPRISPRCTSQRISWKRQERLAHPGW